MKRVAITTALLALAAMPMTAALAEKVQSRSCKPVEVAVFANRIHVKCAPQADKAYTGDITYYAMATNDRSAIDSLTLQVLTAAQASDRNLRVWFDLDDYKSVPGCQGNDCRRLVAVAMQ